MNDGSPTVTVSSGLTFDCPHCGATGHRAAPGSDTFAAPPGHEVTGAFSDQYLMRCWDRHELWWLSFEDVVNRET